MFFWSILPRLLVPTRSCTNWPKKEQIADPWLSPLIWRKCLLLNIKSLLLRPISINWKTWSGLVGSRLVSSLLLSIWRASRVSMLVYRLSITIVRRRAWLGTAMGRMVSRK